MYCNSHWARDDSALLALKPLSRRARYSSADFIIVFHPKSRRPAATVLGQLQPALAWLKFQLCAWQYLPNAGCSITCNGLSHFPRIEGASTSLTLRAKRTSSIGWHRNMPPPLGPSRTRCQLVNEEFELGNAQMVAVVVVSVRRSEPGTLTKQRTCLQEKTLEMACVRIPVFRVLR